MLKIINFFLEFLSGNVLNWQSSEWTMNGGVENETVTHDQFCQKDPHRKYVMFAQSTTDCKVNTKQSFVNFCGQIYYFQTRVVNMTE